MPSVPPTTEATKAALADPVPHIKSVKPFTPIINQPEVVADLRSRIAAARKRFADPAGAGQAPWQALPSDMPSSQTKFAPDMMTAFLERWEKLDLDTFQARLTHFEHYIAEIDWCHLHFIHRRSSRSDAIPLLLLHGWPGSVWEFAEVIDELAEPASQEEPAFHVVVPSLPGYLWSSPPPSTAHYIGDIHGYSRILNALMIGLGYGEEQEGPWNGYAVQGGDWGSAHARVVACVPGSGVRAVHLNFCPALPPGLLGKVMMLALQSLPPAWLLAGVKAVRSDEMVKTLHKVQSYNVIGVYYLMQGNRPGQLMWGMLDSPVALLAYIGPLIAEWLKDGPASDPATVKKKETGLTPDNILELITLYWVTGCVATSFLPYAVNREFESYVVDPKLYIRQPFGYSMFPHELFTNPIGWVAATGNLKWALKAEEGGHFPHIDATQTYLAHIRQAFSQGGKQVATSQSDQPLVPLKGLWDQERSHNHKL